MMNRSQLMSTGQPLPVLTQSQQQVMNSHNQMMMNNQLVNHVMMMNNQSQSQSNGGYRMWPPPQLAVADQLSGYNHNKNWKVNNNNGANAGGAAGGGYYPPATTKVNELQQQNRLKARRYIHKKKHNHSGGKTAPLAPRNTTSFLIRAKKAGGITSLVSPCPVTPAVLPTPNFSPSREVLVDMAKEEWGVDGYGSMKGLIRLRSPGNDDENSASSESEVEEHEHLEVERRLDHDLSRFEMVYPNHGSDLLENRVDDQDAHIARLEEENLMLKERLFLMEREFGKLRTRLQLLEMQQEGGRRLGFIEEVVENDSENESGSRSRGCGRSVEEHNDENSVDNKESDNGVKGLEVAENVVDNKIEDDHADEMAANNESCVNQ